MRLIAVSLEMINNFDDSSPDDKYLFLHCFANSITCNAVKSDFVNMGLNKISLLDIVLLGLYAVDRTLMEQSNDNGCFYIFRDSSIIYLINKSLPINVSSILGQASLSLLTLSQLIYRFTCARKFKISNHNYKQFRINSWGRNYAERYLISSHYEIYNLIRLFYIKYFNDNKEHYNELIRLLNGLSISSTTAQRITTINEMLEIKLLS